MQANSRAHEQSLACNSTHILQTKYKRTKNRTERHTSSSIHDIKSKVSEEGQFAILGFFLNNNILYYL